MESSKVFWDSKYLNSTTGWDIGQVSPPLKAYLDQLNNKDSKILIPGAGRAYEVIYAFNQGFKNIFVCDISPTAIKEFKHNYPFFPADQIIEGDFFKLNPNNDKAYDLILEQTFYCAIPPDRRQEYLNQMRNLLAPTGKLVGILFGITFERKGPPFGGNINTYREKFSNYFDLLHMEPCHNSITPRKGNEVFFIAQKK